MNKFATIVKLFEFKEVIFYSVLIEGETFPLGLQFLQTNNAHPHMPVLMSLIKNMGNKRGAMEYMFRDESYNGSAKALPSPRNILHEECSLRWYCIRMRPSTVVLFNGGEKTAQTAQDCPNVWPHFLQANELSNKIWKAFDEGEITFNSDDRLELDDEFKLEL